MAVFENCYVLLELKDLPFKERKKLKSAVTENGGNISFVVNKQCSLIVTSDVSSLSSNRLRSIQRYQTPVVGVGYVHSCLERGVLLPVDEYKLDSSCCDVSPPLLISSLSQSPLSHQVSKVHTSKAVSGPTKPVSLSQKEGRKVLGKYRIYTETDSDLPTYPDNFQVAKYSIFQKTNSNTWSVLELQSFKGEKGWKYRVITYRKDDIRAKGVVRDTLVFLSTSEEALEVYKTLRETLQDTGLQLRSTIPPQAHDLVSAPLQQLLLEERLNTGSLSEDVGVFVELLWTEALGCLGNILSVSIDKLSLNDVSRAEGLLLQAQRKLKDGDNREIELVEVRSLLDEVLTLLPLRDPNLPPETKIISQTLDLCQLIRDVLNVSEMNLRNPKPSCVGKYRALRCSIDSVPPNSSEFQAVTALLQDSKVQIQQVVRVSRGVELQTFRREIGNVKPLLHSSSPSNFVGVLSRGLLLPRVGMEHHGIQRTDVGNLGSGIYFTDAVSTSLKYSKPSATDGSRLLLVCDVALGECKDVRKKDFTITKAPEGHHSVHGVRHTPKTTSEFEDDEYVVYSPDQVKLKYVVRFSVEGDQLKEFHPNIDTSAEPSLPSSDQELRVEDDGVENIKNPLEDVTAGLLDSSGQQIPLQAVHVKCKLVDMLSQVIIFQKYTNLSSVPIEAKYVFPLDDSAAVCGFEAFINGKHVVGQVKEKEKARKEYKQAIEKGHGAYLMDQDAPDVFTISVGNLPPGASVLIKVTFVSELIVRDGSILFSLPGSVAPWQESAALNQTTQVTVDKVCVTDEAANMREFTLDMSIEMPYEISRLKCITHQVKIKKTDCKAVVSVLPGEVMTPEGFQLSVTLSEVHLPRMWVEKHPDKDSQACMLVFYPDFEVNSSSEYDEVVLLLDTSESMKGESLRTARRIALQTLKTLQHNLRVNVILFGTDHTEAFMTARPLGESRQAAETFIKCSFAVGGSTELWRPLRALSLLPPSRGVRNLLLLSDGHIQNPELTLQLLRDNAQHSRLFTCGLSPTANRHMLRALAQAGGGAFEFFDTKTKHNWTEKVACQLKRMASPGCSSVSVKWQQFNPTAPPPVQAPKQLHALFNDCHTLVYGFVPHCTQATLLGNLSGQELKTMVSTSELQKTKGTFLHKLTARALIRDYEDGSLDTNEAEHEGKKAELKNFIIELSKEYSILSQFTSFVAIEERDSEQTEEGFTDIPKLIAEEDVDFLPYISWVSPQDSDSEDEQETMIDGCSSRFLSMDEDQDIPEQDEMCFDEMVLDSWEEEEEEEEKEQKKVVFIEDSDSSDDDDMGFGLFSEEDQVKLSKSICEGPGEDIPEEGDMEDMDCSLPSPGFNRKLKKSRKSRKDEDLEPMLEPHYMCAGLVSTGGYREKRSKGSYHSLVGSSLGSMSVLEGICSPRPSEVCPPPAAARPSTVDELLSFNSSSGPPHTALPQPPALLFHLQPKSCSYAGPPHPPPPPPRPKMDAGYVPLCLLPPPQPPPPRVINAQTLSQGYSFSPQRSSSSLSWLPSSTMGPPPERKHSGPVGSTGGPPPPPPSQGSYHGSLVGSSFVSRKSYGGPTIVSDGAQMSLEVESLKIQKQLPQGETSGLYDKLASRPSSGLSGLQTPSTSLFHHRPLSQALSGPLPLGAAGAFSFHSHSDSLPPQPVAVNASATIQGDSTYTSAVDMRSDYRRYSAEPFGVCPSSAAAPPIMAAGGFSFSSSSVPPHTALPQPPAPSFLPQTFKCASFDSHPHPPPPPPKTGAGLVPLGSFPPPPAPLPRVVNARTLSGYSFSPPGLPPPPPSSMILPPPPTPPPSSMIPPPPPPPFAVCGSDTNASASHLGYSLDYSLSRDVPRQAYALGGVRADTVERSMLFGACEMSLSPETREISVGEGLPAPKRSARKARGFGFGKDGMGRRCGGGGFGGSIKHQSQDHEMSDVLFGSSGVEDLAQSDEPAPKREQRRSVGKTRLQFQRPFQSYSVLFEARKLSWTKIFGLQHSEGYWESTTELGELINVDIDFFANVFLKNKGIHSLGVKAHADILRMVATLLVLQLMRVEKLEEGKLLRTLFCLEESVGPRPEHWEEVKRAVDWVCFADRQYPCVYSRLEFGMSWESSTRQLLGYEGLPPFSPLIGLTLQKTAVPLLVH